MRAPLPSAGVVLLMLAVSVAATAEPQLGALVSPGPLTRAHAELEGIRKCQSCHETGQRVTAQKCLACHKAVADRIAAKQGLHRRVTTDCVSCHVEHMGTDAELRPMDTRAFNHAEETGFALDGKHAAVAATCSACHKTRSFLTATPACASCHVNQQFKGLRFDRCNDCHKDPHKPVFETSCATCHNPDSWRTRRMDHAKTAFPLLGKHTAVDCAKCHTAPALKVKPKADTCATCHEDVHRGTFKQDCKVCHTEASFAKAPFDHKVTRFPLTGKHGGVACRQCHKGVPVETTRAGSGTMDFRGLKTDCVTCHADPHRQELGARCESCHSTTSFLLKTFTHAAVPQFFDGSHKGVACTGCHRPETTVRGKPDSASLASRVRFTAATTTCVSCHRDEHLGQVAATCESCHEVAIARFGVSTAFLHDRTTYPLTGKHTAVACRTCHKPVTADFPAGRGTTVRLAGLDKTCRACHADTHLGQVGSACETCHTTQTFAVTTYTHAKRSLRGFFVGAHSKANCSSCHTKGEGRFPAGEGIAMRFNVGSACATCHLDVHDGALGPNCGDCHKPEDE